MLAWDNCIFLYNCAFGREKLLQNEFEKTQEKIIKLKELQGNIFNQLKGEKGLQKKYLLEQKRLNEMIYEQKKAQEKIIQLIKENELS